MNKINNYNIFIEVSLLAQVIQCHCLMELFIKIQYMFNQLKKYV